MNTMRRAGSPHCCGSNQIAYNDVGCRYELLEPTLCSLEVEGGESYEVAGPRDFFVLPNSGEGCGDLDPPRVCPNSRYAR